MEEGEGCTLISASQLEDFPDLFHRIQSMLPVKDAGRTCVLSKTWLHAWSTIPTLRFGQMFANREQRRKHLMVVDRTLLRYLQDNIPIETIDLEIEIENQELASLAEKWIRQVATNTSLKDISLVIYISIASLTLPDEIYLGEKLNKISITTRIGSKINPLWMSSNPMIKCVYLQELELINVHISEDVLNNLLSTCSLLKKITLQRCKGLNTIRVKTLRYLSKLRIDLDKEDSILEIDDVPNLCWFSYDSMLIRPLTFNMDSLVGVTCLLLTKVIIDDTFFNMIESKFHFLESLTLLKIHWSPQSFKITCPPLKRLIINSEICHIPLNLQVFAPKLLFFRYDGMLMPSLVFPANTPKKIEIKLWLSFLIDVSFFIKIRETLMLSSKFYIQINMLFKKPLNIDIDDLKRRVSYPATNVQQLSFESVKDKGLWEHSPFFDAFFSICHPKNVVAIRDLRFQENNYFCKLMVREVMEKKSRKGYWPDYLKDVEIKNCQNGKWEKLTDSWKSILDGSTQVYLYKVEFKLNWH